jgi:hypothetical protein
MKSWSWGFIVTFVVVVIFGLLGCGSVDAVMQPDGGGGSSGAAGVAGSGGAGTAGTAGSTGTAGTTGSAGAGGAPVCSTTENTIDDCRATGTALITAYYYCTDTHDPNQPTLLTGMPGTTGHIPSATDICGVDGKITAGGYYAGLPCPPIDAAIKHLPNWTGPCPECTDGVIITNSGGSTDAVWRNTPSTIYCCNGDGKTLQKIARCR